MASARDGKGRASQARSSTARGVALAVLLRVERDEAFAAAVLDAELEKSGLEQRDRGLATELAYGAIRWQGVLDGRIDAVASRPAAEQEPLLRCALRLGAYQLLATTRIPDHAAVAETVELVRSRRGKKLAGFANAVLRQLARGDREPLAPEEALPRWLRREVEERRGEEEMSRFARWSVEQPWTGLRAETSRASAEALAERLRREVPAAEIRPGRHSAVAVLARGLGPPQRLRAYRDGWMAVQDEGAQVVTTLLDLSPGQRVLDACAGRGGKTTFLAAMAMGRSTIDAADRHPGKLEVLEAELARLGRPGAARTVPVDLEVGSAGLRPPYDRILVDVPCSGTGTIGRRPEIRWRLARERRAGLLAAQRRILDRCLGLLAPGGTLVYVACSVLASEGPDQVRRLLAAEEWKGRLSLSRELALWPQLHGTDGFYAARLVASRRREGR